MEDLIAPEDVVVTLSHTGYVKSQKLDEYRAQKRGGRGKQATTTKEDDFIEKLFIANTHDYVLCFSNKGKVYWIKVYEVPQGSRGSRGKPIVNLLKMDEDERINAILPVREFVDDRYVFFATQEGVVKKTALSDFSRPRASGIIAVDLDEGDRLIGVALTDGRHDVMLFSDEGKAVRFDENDVRPMGRGARGVRGMNLAKGGKVIALLVAEDEAQSVLTATENGYGKRTPIAEYTRHGRGTLGMIAIQTSARNGKVVAATLVSTDDEIMLITSGGVLIRTRVKEIREMGRSTQGVTLINLGEGEKLSGPADRDGPRRGRERQRQRQRQRRRSRSRLSGRRDPGGGEDAMHVWNFGSGPAMLVPSVLEQAKSELLDWHGMGMSVMEMSHRGKEFVAVAAEAEADLRKLLAVPANYKVLFLQGGATVQFAAVPMNLLRGKGEADFVVTGEWSKKAHRGGEEVLRPERRRHGEGPQLHLRPEAGGVDSSRRTPPTCTSAPTRRSAAWSTTGRRTRATCRSSPTCRRTSCRGRWTCRATASSTPARRRTSARRAWCIVIVREDLIGHALPDTPNVLDYKLQADADSMLNTPPTFSLYLAGLTFKWLLAKGGLAAMERDNVAKAELLYDYLDAQDVLREPGGEGGPLAHERAVPPEGRLARRALPRRGRGARAVAAQGPPLGGRDARLDLQRDAARGRGGARRVPQGLRAPPRADRVSRAPSASPSTTRSPRRACGASPRTPTAWSTRSPTRTRSCCARTCWTRPPCPPSVKAIARAGAGVNNIPVAEMSRRGIPVFNAPGANANAVKELVMAAILLAARNLVAAIDGVRALRAGAGLRARASRKARSRSRASRCAARRSAWWGWAPSAGSSRTRRSGSG